MPAYLPHRERSEGSPLNTPPRNNAAAPNSNGIFTSGCRRNQPPLLVLCSNCEERYTSDVLDARERIWRLRVPGSGLRVLLERVSSCKISAVCTGRRALPVMSPLPAINSISTHRSTGVILFPSSLTA